MKSLVLELTKKERELVEWALNDMEYFWTTEDGAFRELHEKERVFVDMNKNTPLVKWAKQHKTGRNEPCPCGSERKYKNCCLHRDELLNNPQPPKGE